MLLIMQRRCTPILSKIIAWSVSNSDLDEFENFIFTISCMGEVYRKLRNVQFSFECQQ